MTQPNSPAKPPQRSGPRAAMFILVGFGVLALLAFALYAGLRWLGPQSTLMNTTAGSPQTADQAQPPTAATPASVPAPAPTPAAR